MKDRLGFLDKETGISKPVLRLMKEKLREGSQAYNAVKHRLQKRSPQQIFLK